VETVDFAEDLRVVRKYSLSTKCIWEEVANKNRWKRMNIFPRPYLHKIDMSNRWVDVMIEDHVIFRCNMFQKESIYHDSKIPRSVSENIDASSRARCFLLFHSFCIKFLCRSHTHTLSLSLPPSFCLFLHERNNFALKYQKNLAIDTNLNIILLDYQNIYVYRWKRCVEFNINRISQTVHSNFLINFAQDEYVRR